MLYAVTGATGQLGRRTIASLLKKASPNEVIGLARDPAKAEALEIPTRIADYGDVAALEHALQGVDRLLLVSSYDFEQRLVHHRNVVTAAKKAGVSFIAYTGLLHANAWTLDFAEDHKSTERVVQDSGIPFSILRNGWYFENYTSNLRAALANGALLGSAGNGRISFASRQDLAEAAAAVLIGQGHEGRTYELAGDRAYSLADLSAETSRQAGQELPYRNLSQAEHAEFLMRVGLPEGLATMLAEVEAQAIGQNILSDDSGTLSSLIGRPTTSLSKAVTDALKA